MKKIVFASMLVLVSGSVMAAVDPAVQTGIDDTVDNVILYIGMAIVAGLALMGASLAPEVGMTLGKRWIRKGAK